MTEIKGTYKVKHGGKRVAGPGKLIGRPTDMIGTKGKKYSDYLDDETIEALKSVHPVRSIAIRMLAKSLRGL